MSNTLPFRRPTPASAAAEEPLAALKAQIDELVRQRRTLPSAQRSAELRTLLDLLILEGRKLGWDAERSLLLARALGVEDRGAEDTKAPLDHSVAAMERRWRESGIPDLYEGGNGPVSRERARNVRALLYPKPAIQAGRIENTQLAGPNGSMALRIYWPITGAATGTLVYYHGGGWMLCDIDSHDAHCLRFANRSRVVVVSVDYRLAPEHPFPQGVSDAVAALDWAHAHRAELGGAGQPLCVGGDSSGGNLAAVAALHARDHGIPLAAQVLIYPPTDLRAFPHPGVARAYFGDQAERLALDPRASPILASHQGVAPAIIGVGVHDVLYANNLAYAATLRAAGVPVRWREYADLGHAFFSYTAISASCTAAADQLCDDLHASLSSE
jgi:acetyl esterase/lipase